MAQYCNITTPTVTKAIQQLEELKIVKEITGKERHKVYVYDQYLDILNKEIGEFANNE